MPCGRDGVVPRWTPAEAGRERRHSAQGVTGDEQLSAWATQMAVRLGHVPSLRLQVT